MSKKPAKKTAATILKNEPAAQPPRDDGRSLTRKQFCELEGFSLSTYHEMKRKGTGPVELHIPGMALIRISAQARLDWQRRREESDKTQTADLERQRRSAQAAEAGKKAAASPRHVSKRSQNGANAGPRRMKTGEKP